MADEFIDGQVENQIPQRELSVPSKEVASQCSTPKTTRKRVALTDVDVNVSLEDEPTEKQKEQKKSKKDKIQREKPAKKRCNDRSQPHKDQSQPTGVILDLAEFDFEEQRTTLADEMCKDAKLIKETVRKLEKSLEALQKAVEESNKKLNEHTAICPIATRPTETQNYGAPLPPITQPSHTQSMESALPIAPLPQGHITQPSHMLNTEVDQDQLPFTPSAQSQSLEDPLPIAPLTKGHITQPSHMLNTGVDQDQLPFTPSAQSQSLEDLSCQICPPHI